MRHHWSEGTEVHPAVLPDLIRFVRTYQSKVLRISPNDALKMGLSQEIHSYMCRSIFAMEPFKSDNCEYGMPPALYGLRLYIDEQQPEGVATFENGESKISIFLVGA